MNIAIVGGGIAGLSFALGLHKRGIDCDVFEAVNEVKEIGVGITLLPHAMRELAEIGVQSAIEAAGIENFESVFFHTPRPICLQRSSRPTRWLFTARNWRAPR